jgi:hypothetical protein
MTELVDRQVGLGFDGASNRGDVEQVDVRLGGRHDEARGPGD